MANYPDIEVHFVSLSSSEIEERSARLRELLLRGALRFVHSQTGNDMTVKRAGHTATLLNDGKVLLAGPYLTAEIFDPSVGIGTFTATGSLPGTTGWVGTTATLRPDGTVLVAGGQNLTSCGPDGLLRQSVAAADLFNPGTGSFSQTSNMSELRSQHTATLLANGRVLVTGGIAWSLVQLPGTIVCKQKVSVSAGAELFP